MTESTSPRMHPTQPSPLLTFEDLVAQAEEFRRRANAADSIAGWDRLLEVARSLAASGAGDDDIARGRTWHLLRVRIEGYQGVGTEPLEIDFDPSPGITVLQGSNGSGKSSIADAIETALHGAPRATSATGTGGNAPLWEREHCGRDVIGASVEATLIAGQERLMLSCRIDSDGQVTQRQVRRTVHGGAPIDVDPLATTWRSALAGHRPVFGYATVERQVQVARNLQEFLEPLLAFGGCFDELKAQVKGAGATATEAKARWDRALTDAQRAVTSIDAQRTRPDAPDLPKVVWPAIADNPGDWIVTSGLTETGGAVPEVTEKHFARLRDASAAAIAALDTLEAAETSLHARLAAPLNDLHQRVEHLDERGQTCPVCATSEVPWRSTLATILGGLTATEIEDIAFRGCLADLRLTLDSDLVDIEDALDQDWCTPAVREQAAETLALCNSLRIALDSDGQRATPLIRAAARSAGTNLASEAWRHTVQEVADRSDHLSQWSRARRAAVDAFIYVWQDTGAVGAAAGSWTSAERCLRTLQTQLRQRRTENLQAMAASTVHDLLHDVGLSITGLSIQETKAAMTITDSSGKIVRLSMLSAGQRNALLLAPLLAVSRGGPFGFLVLDDPVHAFDQVRVDRLAQLVHDLAADRRVIVLTHDERLKEHLLARSPHYDARAIYRNPIDGQVTEKSTHDMWRVLVNDAFATWKLAPKSADMTVTTTDLVRGMCRMALDDALRRFVLQQALLAHLDPEPALASIDAQLTTRDRFKEAQKQYPGHAQLAAAEPIVEPHLGNWNRAAHGNPPTSAVDLVEIKAAESACRALLGIS